MDTDSEYAYFGIGLEAGPDVDGDGFPDIAAGAAGPGTTYIISGADFWEETATTSDDALATIISDGTGAAGITLVFQTDHTGDGIDDLVIAEPLGDANDTVQGGAVGVISKDVLSDTLHLDDADVVWHAPADEYWFGNGVFNAGDQDDDGIADLLVGGGKFVAFSVIPGGTTGGDFVEQALTLTWVEDGKSYAPPVHMVGDVDGDGHNDAMTLEDEARVYIDLLSQPTRGLITTPPYATIDSNGDGSGTFIYDAIDLGDRDGDGLAETLLTVPEDSQTKTAMFAIVEGASLTLGAELSLHDSRLQGVSSRPDSFFGQRAAVVGDTTGDGQDDLVIGGFSDDEGGVNAGGVVVVTVPE